MTKVNEGSEDISVPLVIIETKHLPKIDSRAVAQTLGYFCKGQGRKTSTKQGLAILFNGFDNKVQVKIFTFPYCNQSKGYGIQSLVLPVYECSYEEFIDSKFLNFLLILCSPTTDYLFRIIYQPIKAIETVLVVSDAEFAFNKALREQAILYEEILEEKEKRIEEDARRIEMLERELREIQQRIQHKPQNY